MEQIVPLYSLRESRCSLKTILSPTAYLPSVSFFAHAMWCGHITLDHHENYVKQSFRNRCKIAGSSGVQELSIPVKRSATIKAASRSIKIDYSTNWTTTHQRSLQAAYGKSPYFEYYSEELLEIILSSEEYLVDLNLKLLSTLVKLLGVDISITSASRYIDPCDEILLDIRSQKKNKAIELEGYVVIPYIQVFSSKTGFQPNLSIVDLLFNEGPMAIENLRSGASKIQKLKIQERT